MKWSLLLLFAGAAFAGDSPHLFYARAFPGSAPPYFDVTLDRGGNAVYRESVDDEVPVRFRLSEADTKEIFDLADKLGHFKHPLESAAKVAFTGAKTFRYEDGAEKNEVKYNFSEDPAARALQDWFERMAESAEHRENLERAAKYDRLGVVKALTLLENSLDKKRLVGLDQFLPMLDRIANNESYMHTARVQAASLAEGIRKQQTQP